MGDFKNCRADKVYFFDDKVLKKEAEKIIKKSGFEIVDFCSHKFGGGGGISLVFLVSESHVAIHTWPENSSLNLDIFFCNYSKKNEMKARRAFEMFRDLYKPRKVMRKNIKRHY